MTDPTTRLRLDVALDQLLNPETQTLQRDRAAARAQLDQLDAAHLDHIRDLARRHRDAARRRDHAGMRRNIDRMTRAGHHHRERHAQLANELAADQAAIPPLLERLLEAIHNSSNTGGTGSSAAAHRSPVGLAALTLVHDIAHTTGHRGDGWLGDTLRAWQPDDIDTAAEHAEQWIEKARSILDPSPRRGLIGRCLSCGKGIVHVPDDSGEIVRKLALQVDAKAATTCLSCGAHTPPERAHLLAAALDQQREEDRADRARRAVTRAR